MDPMCTQNPWAITVLLLCTAVPGTAVAPCFSSTHVSEGARPTQGLIIVSRCAYKGMARLFDLGQGSSVNDSCCLDADDSQFCSAAMTAEVRIG